MTVSSTVNRKAYTGNGVTTSFAFPHPVLEATHLKVYVGTTLKVLTTDYTLSGTAPYVSGTNVVFVTAPANNAAVLIIRDPSILQQTDLVENDPLPAEQVERAYDYRTMVEQRLAERIDRSLQLADTDTGTLNPLPPVAERASMFFAWDATGQPTALQSITLATRNGVKVVATAGQTLFSNWGFTYTVGTRNMDVFVNGLLMIPGTDYTETSTSSITFTAGLDAGDEVFFTNSTPMSVGVYSTAVPYVAAGDSTSRSVYSRLGDIVSVRDYGPEPSGASDVLSFNKAIAAAIAKNGYNNVEVYVPQAATSWTIDSSVDTQGAHVRYICAAGTTFTNYANLNGTVVRPYRTTRDTFGTGDNACGHAVVVHAADAEAQIMGIASDSELATYTDRDSAGFFVQNTAPAKFFETTGTTYTATTVVSLTAPDPKSLKIGMLIDTLHATKFSGRITGWSADAKTITVSGWYEMGNTAAGQVPPNTAHAVINPVTKVWAHNANVEIQASSYASAAAGWELGVVNNKADWAPGSREIWGYDCNNLGTKRNEAAFVQRGDFYYGFSARGAYKACFHTGGTGLVADYGLWMELAHTKPILYAPSGVQRFSIEQDGSLELGGVSTVQNPFIDFHSSGNSNDFDVRITATGGAAGVGLGTLKFQAANLELAGIGTTGVAPPAGAGGALPATPEGYMSFVINGSIRKIPYYPN